ncbi:hypothetical protein ACLKA6_017402 [Drosophila palustris]
MTHRQYGRTGGARKYPPPTAANMFTRTRFQRLSGYPHPYSSLGPESPDSSKWWVVGGKLQVTRFIGALLKRFG